MKAFNQDIVPPSHGKIETPYQRAKQEWDDRIGNARIQAQNWRFVAVLSLLVAIILLVMLMFSLSMNKNNIFVAEVTKAGRVVDIVPLKERYQPKKAQEEYFLGHFVKLIREIPLDPVVAKRNWLTAYHFLSDRGVTRLNAYFKENNPVKWLGKKTVLVKINDINPVSENTFALDWVETMVDINGDEEGQKTYSGVFTVSVKPPATQKAIFQNPLGIYIVDFHISTREK